jgi:hypothetical protein
MSVTLEHSLKDADMAVTQLSERNMSHHIFVPTQTPWPTMGPNQFLGGKKPTKFRFIIMVHFCREIHDAIYIVNNLLPVLGLC